MENIAVLEQEESSIRSRRNALLMGGAALAGLAVTRGAQAQAAAITDTDILNFALNLEYLEAQYYTLATTGQTIDQLTSGPISVASGGGTAGGTVTVKANARVPFATNSPLLAYALETAQEERNHVVFLRAALNAGGANAAVAQPNINLLDSFNTLAAAAGIQGGFDPFASEANFLIGAYIFEDVGVSAYLGAAPAIKATANLVAALQIHAVEAYHAGIVRTQIFRAGASAQGLSQAVSKVRQQLSAASPITGTNNLDVGVSVANNAALNQQASTVVDVDPTTAIVIGRSTTQVLNIVYGGANLSGKGGLFFPNGVNGNIK